MSSKIAKLTIKILITLQRKRITLSQLPQVLNLNKSGKRRTYEVVSVLKAAGIITTNRYGILQVDRRYYSVVSNQAFEVAEKDDEKLGEKEESPNKQAL